MSALTPGERLRIAFELHDTGRRMYLQNLRWVRPELSEQELREALLHWLVAE